MIQKCILLQYQMYSKQCIMFLPSLTKDTFGGKKLLATRFTVIFFKRPFIITKPVAWP